MSRITVVLADDHPVVRKGIASLLAEDPEVEVVAQASDGDEAVRVILEKRPQVAILDIAMASTSGLTAAAALTKAGVSTRVIILSMYSDEEYVMRALVAGVRGYLVKDVAESDILEAIHRVADGRYFFSKVISESLLYDYIRRLKEEGLRDSYDLLTEREKEVLLLLAEAKSNKEVAASLNLSLHTVESHRTNLMQKLNLHNAAEIVLYAVRKKLIQ